MSRAHEKDSGLLQWLRDQGEERLSQLRGDVSRNKTLLDAVHKAVRGAAETKGRIDRNMQTVLALLNLPSRGDYEKLLRKIETLQGSLLNLNVKLDRVLAALATAPPASRSARKIGRKRVAGAE
jgi:hypothetical protein